MGAPVQTNVVGLLFCLMKLQLVAVVDCTGTRRGLPVLAAALALLALVVPAKATLPPEPAARIGLESFNYPDGTIAGQSGGALWDWDNVLGTHTGAGSDWDNVTGSPLVQNGALVTLGSAARREYNGPGEGLPNTTDEGRGAVNDLNTQKVVYYRVRMKRNPGAERSVVTSLDFGAERVSFGVFTAGAAFGIDVAGSRTFSFAIPQSNQTYTLVAKIDYAGDRIRLFIDPNLAGSEPTTASVEMAYSGTHWSTAVQLAGTGSGATTWDDLAVAASWDELRDPVLVTTATDEDDVTAAPGVGRGTSLREAIKYSPPGSYISFASSLTGQTLGLVAGEIPITKSVLLDGGSFSPGVAISGRGQSRIFAVQGTNTAAFFYRLALVDGAGSFGGAVYCNQAKALGLSQCTVSGSTASSGGGGIYNANTRLSLTHCTIVGNTAPTGFGGGLENFQDGPPIVVSLRHCTISANSSPIGGGLYTQGSIALHQCIVAGNTALGPSFGPDLRNAIGQLTASGANVIGVNHGLEAQFPTGPLAGTGSNPLSPRLAPLGHYGGPTPTRPPLAASPARNAGGASDPGGVDQRGLARFVGGALDIGAVEATSAVVQNLTDAEPGSLRATIAAAPANAVIEFAPELSGQRVVLAGAEIVIDKPVAISAASLPGGLLVDAGLSSRLFRITTNANGVSLDSLTLTGGKATGDGVTLGTYLGGAVLNEGDLTLHNSTLHGNIGGLGGAIYNGPADGLPNDVGARLRIHNSTLAENSAIEGGALYNVLGSYLLDQSTISGNVAFGGRLPGLTLFGNGGGIAGASSRPTIHHNSIVAGNSARDEQDIYTSLLAFTCTGKNLIGPNIRSAELDPAAVITVSDPKLFPLGYHGGPTPTLHPRQSSPAIDAAGSGPATGLDQRGFPRVVNGFLDIGAVEAGPAIPVSSPADAGPGSLRAAIATANLAPGQRIVFGPALAGATIPLTSGQLTVTQSVIIDASMASRPESQTVVDAQGLSRVLEVGAGATVTLDSMSLVRGVAPDSGGGLRNFGNLTINHCSVSDCSALNGGAIYSEGNLVIDHSTIDRNRANYGGGLYSDTDLAGLQSLVRNSTFARNEALINGGAVYNFDGQVRLAQLTISSNVAPAGGFGGVASYGDALTSTRVGGTIISANAGDDVGLVGSSANNSFTSAGYNLVGVGHAVSAFNQPGDLSSLRNPRLLPLARYGGPTMTMHPAVGSPAIDRGGATDPGGTDQRGFSRFVHGALDIGAVEAVFGPQVPYFAVAQSTNRLEITYDLFDPEVQFLQVRIEFSANSGQTWAAATNASGAVGDSVERGSRRQISWDVRQALGPIFTTQLRVRLVVTGNSVNPTVVSSDNLTLDTRPRTVTVLGRVLDSLGNPVADATVVINALPSVSTATDGSYSVPNVAREGGTLTVSKAIYSPQARFIAPIAGITQHVVDDVKLTRLAFQVTDITRDVEGIYLGGDFSFDVRATAHIDWGGRVPGRVDFYVGNTLLKSVPNPAGNIATITFNTANLASGLLPYSTVEMRAEAVAANNEVSRSARETLEFVGVSWLDALPLQAQQVGGFEPRYTFSAKWPIEVLDFLDLDALGDLGVDLGVNLGLVYAPRSGEWELWLGDTDNVRSNWRPRSFGDDDAGGFTIGGQKLSLDTRAFASGQASRRGFGFNQLNVQTTLNYHQRLGEVCLTDLLDEGSGAIRQVGSVLETAGYDFNSLQCLRFDLDIDGTLRLAATAPAGQLRFQDGSFTAGGTLSAYYKPELGRLVEFLAKLSGGIDLTLGVPRFEYRGTTVRAVAELKAGSTIPFVSNLSYANKWVLLDKTFNTGSGGGGGGVVTAAGVPTLPEHFQAMEVVDTKILSGLPIVSADETFVANDRPDVAGAGGLDPTFQPANSGSVGVQTNQILVRNVSVETRQAMAAKGNELMLVYSRSLTPTSQQLVWSRFDGTTWSTPAAIPGAVSAAILQPSIAYDGNGSAIVVWQQFASTPAAGADVTTVTSGLELGWSRFTGGSWSAAQALTSNGIYDGEPRLCGPLPDGDLLLVWRQSLPGESFAVRGTLSSRRWDTGTLAWRVAQVVDSAFSGTSDFDCASGDGKVVIVWSGDLDANFATSTDSEIYYRIWQNESWGSAIRFTTDNNSDRNARVAIGQSGAVFMAWVRNNELVCSKDFTSPAVVQANVDALGAAGLQLSVGPTENPILLWSETFGIGSDGRYAVFDTEAGVWGQPSALWKDADAERNVAMAWDPAGRLQMTYLKDRLVSTAQQLTALDANGVPVTLTVSNVTETASVDLAFTRKSLLANLTLRKLTVADEYFLPGNTIALSATLENTGDRAVQNPRVQFKFLPGGFPPEVLISNVTLAGWMPAQSTQHIAATWVLPSNISQGLIVAVVDPLGAVVESDESAADNEKSLQRGGRDLVVALKSKTVYPNRTARIVGSIFNAGAPASFAFPSAFRVRRSDGSVVGSAFLPSVAPGDTVDVAVNLPAGFQTSVIDTYTIEADATQSGDVDSLNNTSRFTIELTPEYLDPIPVTNGLQLRLTAKAGTSTTVNGAPVAGWIDQQNGHEFTSANAVLPTYIADSGGGQPAIDFRRNSGFMGSFASTAGATIGDATIFVVGRFAGYSHPSSDASYFYSIDSSTGGSEHSLGRQQRAGVGPDALFHNRGQPAQATYLGANIVEDAGGAFTLYTATFRGAASGGGVSALINRQDGQLINVSGSATSAYEADPAKTRIGLSTANDNGLDGMIREVVVFNRILSSQEMEAVYGYLARRSMAATGPVILTQPASTGGCVGGTANFFVATDLSTATYQWQRRLPGANDFQNISGATAASYSTPTLAPGDDGSAFRVVVTANGTSVTSAEASLAVIAFRSLTAFYDFDHAGLENASLYGVASIDEQLGVLELNPNRPNQSGAFLTSDLAPGAVVEGFAASFEARVEAGSSVPADGFSFNWATNLPAGTYPNAEQGAGSGLRVTFDTFGDTAIEVLWADNLVARRYRGASDLVRGPDFFPVQIRLTPDGFLDVTYACEPIFVRLPIPGYVPQRGAKFGLAARTGGSYESHGIDNLALELYFDPASVPGKITSIQRQPAAGVRIDGTGAPGRTYPLEVSTDLINWTLRTNVVTDAGGLWQWAEPSIVTPAHRFYRLRRAQPVLFNTGLNASGLPLNAGAVDPHYRLIVNADSASTNALVHGEVFPIDPNGPWLANNATSKWLSPRTDSLAAASGDYIYRTTVDLTGRDLSQVRITGRWSTDNAGRLRVNGTDTAFVTGFDHFNFWTAFNLNANTVQFVSGLNTFDFIVNNAAGGPTGLRVEFTEVVAP